MTERTSLQHELGNCFCNLNSCFEEGATITDVESMLAEMGSMVDARHGVGTFRESIEMAAIHLSMLQVGMRRFAERNGYELP